MNVQNAKEATERIFKTTPDVAVCWVGGTGLGKTTVAKDLAKSLGLPLSYVPIRSEDWAGYNLPDSKRTSVRFVPSEPLKAACLAPALVYLDEINRVDQYSRGQLLELVGERQVGGLSLHAESVILTTCNDESDKYQTKETDNALKTRMIALPITFDADLSEKWAETQGYSLMRAFVSAHPEVLHEEVTWPVTPNTRLLALLSKVAACGLNTEAWDEIAHLNLGERAKKFLSANRDLFKKKVVSYF